jgi:DNA-binding NarL/FixJ family response regulator
MPMLSTKILVVEDFEQFRGFIVSTLRETGKFQIMEAADGLEALQKAEAYLPDLVLLDIGLPRLHGIEVARRIRQIVPTSKILFLSQESSAEIVFEAFRLGAHGYLLKSDAGELALAVDSVLQGRQFVSSRLQSRAVIEFQNERPGNRLSSERRPPLPTQVRETGRIHEVAWYRDDASFIDGFARFAESALQAKNPVVVIATDSHRSSLTQKLQQRGWDIAAAIREGSYTALDATDTLSIMMVNDWPDVSRVSTLVRNLIEQVARAAKGMPPRVMVCGECAPTLLAQGKVEASIELEHLWDDIARRHEIDILCGYVLNETAGVQNTQIFERIGAEHSAAYSL